MLYSVERLDAHAQGYIQTPLFSTTLSLSHMRRPYLTEGLQPGFLEITALVGLLVVEILHPFLLLRDRLKLDDAVVWLRTCVALDGTAAVSRVRQECGLLRRRIGARRLDSTERDGPIDLSVLDESPDSVRCASVGKLSRSTFVGREFIPLTRLSLSAFLPGQPACAARPLPAWLPRTAPSFCHLLA